MKKSLLLTLALACCAAFADVPAGTDISTLNKTDNPEQSYRHRDFKAYRPLEALHKRLKIANYSSYENPTGIWFTAGQTAKVTLTGDAPVTLKLRSFYKDGQNTDFELKPGENVITIPHDGALYVDYRSETPETAPAVHLDIEGGAINGVFTKYDDKETWKKLVANAVAPTLDCMGERCQLVLDLQNIRDEVPNDGDVTLANYDKIIEIEQKEVLGWDRYKLHPGNHIMGRVMYNGFMHADGLGAAFINTCMGPIINPATMLNQSWGIAHEFGHVNQTRNSMMWTGMTEVTNNICSALVNYRLAPENLRLEHETGCIPEGIWLRGSRYDSFVNSAVVHHQMWQFQAGPDNGSTPVDGANVGDPFVICIPFWQLQLYCGEALHNPMFYPTIFETARNTDETGMTMGDMRLRFMENACDSAKLDLTDYFLATGMLTPMNRMVGDYASHIITITKEMCLDTIKHIKDKKYPKPETSVIYYISGNNMPIYRDKLPLEPSPDFKPEIKDNRFTVPAGTWKNAVAFEVYAKGELVRVCLLGLNHEDNVTTDVLLPEGADEVKAVQWDGKRESIWTK